MKLKLKTTYIGLLLIGIMLSSSVAGTFLQSVFSPKEKEEEELIKEKIIDYALSLEQENKLLTNGITILKFNYSLSCSSCLEEKTFLEQLATSSQFKEQIILQENLEKNNLKTPVLIIRSAYGQKTLTVFDVNKTVDYLCDLIVRQPYECVLRKAV